jgi:hypothetical protein
MCGEVGMELVIEVVDYNIPPYNYGIPPYNYGYLGQNSVWY